MPFLFERRNGGEFDCLLLNLPISLNPNRSLALFRAEMLLRVS
jgi:hypothetical protein